jgi:hypothetical protein
MGNADDTLLELFDCLKLLIVALSIRLLFYHCLKQSIKNKLFDPLKCGKTNGVPTNKNQRENNPANFARSPETIDRLTRRFYLRVWCVRRKVGRYLHIQVSWYAVRETFA